MEFIKLFIVGSVGYILAGLYDVAILYDKSLLKRVLFIGFFLTGIPYLYIPLILSSVFPLYILILVIPLLLFFLSLLIYSVFIEIHKNHDTSSVLYQKGTYSFSRHPGFLWYTAINCIFVCYYWDIRVTFLCASLTLCNLALITIEDLFIFPRMFSQYHEYKKHTPFLFSLDSFSRWRNI